MAEVLAFAPRRQEVPALRCAELRLSEDCRIVEMTLLDEAGNVEVLEYALASSPPDFDLDRLRTAWDEWRGSSTKAS
jgi:hypothetical protein